jgi:hypothetical protein
MHADTDRLKAELENERLRNQNLTNLVEENERVQQRLVGKFQSQLVEKDRHIARLGMEIDDLKISAAANQNTQSSTATVDALKDQVSTYEARIELIEKDNTRLRKENMDLGVMVQQCLEKIQRDLADKPHWVDRRVVCSSIATLLKELDSIDESSGGALELHASARQRLGDVLGLTFEERNAMGLLNVPADRSLARRRGIGEDFVTFLERESAAADNSQITEESTSPKVNSGGEKL